MRTLMLAVGAMSLAIPAAIALPAGKAEAKVVNKINGAGPGYQKHRKRHHAYREWRGRDGRRYCRRSDGTTGLVVGAVGGALLGRTIDTHGDRSGGTLIGAIAGGLAGREIERGSDRNRCR